MWADEEEKIPVNDYECDYADEPWVVCTTDENGFWWNQRMFQPAPRIWVSQDFLDYVFGHVPGRVVEFQGGDRWRIDEGTVLDGMDLMLHYEGPKGKHVWKLVWPPIWHPQATKLRMAVWPD